ncbi:MAG: IS66-like element accessory protein TnpA [Bradyrhizobium sp.]
MDMHKDSSLVHRLEIVETGRRRRFSEAEKRRVVEESYAGSRLASATARRHGISVPLLFSWRRAYVQDRLGGAALPDLDAEPIGFVPAVVADRPSTRGAASRAASGFELIARSGERIVLGSDFDAVALARLLDVLERRR